MMVVIWLLIQIQVAYKNPKTYLLTPKRKHIGKAVARKSKKTIASEALKDQQTKQYIIKLIGKELAKEVQVMCSDAVKSILQSRDPEHLKHFSWDVLLCELTEFAPILKDLLFSATKTQLPRANTNAIIGTCAAILMKHCNSRMNLVQKINSLVLYAAHTSKQVSNY